MAEAPAKSFHCSVVTPERAVTEVDARFVALPAHDGEVGILRGRAPLVVKLDVGRLRIQKADGGDEEWFIDGGFAEMVGDRLTVLTEAAARPEELDRETAEKALAEARAMEAVDDEAFAARQHALKAARLQLRMLE